MNPPINKWQAMVLEFHEATNSTIGDNPAMRDPHLRAKLIMEEAVETVAAMGFEVYGEIFEPLGEKVAGFEKHYAQPDLSDAIDGICDLIYVLCGAAVTMGFDIDPHFAEVHRANMTKITGPKRADGKQLKPEGWQPPDHGAILDAM